MATAIYKQSSPLFEPLLYISFYQGG